MRASSLLPSSPEGTSLSKALTHRARTLFPAFNTPIIAPLLTPCDNGIHISRALDTGKACGSMFSISDRCSAQPVRKAIRFCMCMWNHLQAVISSIRLLPLLPYIRPTVSSQLDWSLGRQEGNVFISGKQKQGSTISDSCLPCPPCSRGVFPCLPLHMHRKNDFVSGNAIIHVHAHVHTPQKHHTSARPTGVYNVYVYIVCTVHM